MARQCPKAGACGACKYNGVKYSKQLEEKQMLEESLLSSFCRVAPIIGMEDPFFYRNKVQSVVGKNKKGDVVSGIYRFGTHDLIPVHDCMLEDRDADSVLASVIMLAKKYGISVYDEDRHVGFLRHVLIRKGIFTGQIMVVLVASSFDFRQKDRFLSDLIALHPQITTVLLNKNSEQTSMVLSAAPERVLYGPGYIEDLLCNLRFRISAKSFYQVNSVQAKRLYTIAMRMARFSGNEEVIDAYCGTGTIGLVAASWGAGHVTGIELNPDAVNDAIANAEINNIGNASFVCGDAGEVLKQMAKDGKTCDVLFMDPPRSGSDERFLASVIKLKPRTVIYISCNPETLARDLRYITHFSSYRVEGIQPVDMFPQTAHVETVVLMSRDKE